MDWITSFSHEDRVAMTLDDLIEQRIKERLPGALVKALSAIGLYVGPEEEQKIKDALS